MRFSTGQTLTKTSGLKPITYADIKVHAQTPLKIPVTQEQYHSKGASERGELKKSQQYFITSPAKTRSQKAVKASGLTGIVLDLDNPTSDMEGVRDILMSVGVMSFLVYTSLSHTKEQPRFRVVVPLSEEVKQDRWQMVAGFLCDALFVDSDSCSKTMAQAWLMPVVTVDGDYASIEVEEGEPLNILDDNHPLVVSAQQFSDLMQESENAKPASPREFSLEEGELSPIQVYNQQNDLRAVMKEFGYVFKSKNRAIHPASQSGSAGVYIFPEGDRAFSHHGGDPLNGKSFDAFDLYVQFEMHGSLSNAIQAVGDTYKTPEGLTLSEHNRKLFSKRKAYNAVPSYSWDELLEFGQEDSTRVRGVNESKADIAPPPVHCFHFTGIGKNIYDNIVESAIYPQPTFALSSTLMILSMLGEGRLTGTQTHVRSNLMFMCIGESGCGKQHNINKIDEVTRLVSFKLNDKVRNKFASGPAFWSFLNNNSPELLFLSDECGFLFNTIKNGKTDYLAQLYDCFLQGYSASCSVLKSTVYAATERNDFASIEYPHICLMGFTTGSTLADALTHEDSATGLLPRLMFFPAMYDVPEKQKYNPIKFDRHAIEGFKLAHQFTNWKGSLPYTRKYPLHVPSTPEAEAMLDEFGNKNRKAMRQAESMERNLLNRAEENARRLALVYWMDRVCPTNGDGKFSLENMIQVEDARKAIDLVEWSLAYAFEFMTDRAGATITSKEVERLVSIVNQAKVYAETRQGDLFDRHREALSMGLLPRAILVKLSKKSAKNVDDLLETAGAMEMIAKYIEPTKGTIYYVPAKGRMIGE